MRILICALLLHFLPSSFPFLLSPTLPSMRPHTRTTQRSRTLQGPRLSAGVVEDERLQELVRCGRLRVWRKAEAPQAALAGGARGAGHSADSWKGHVEPDAIYVIGTSHVSEESASDVQRVIRILQPNNVVVELCRSRAGMMYQDPSTLSGSSALSLGGTGFVQTLARSLSLGGGGVFLIRALLAKSPAVSKALGTRVGVDFRAARIEGEACGAQIILGDRPIEITLERAWRSLTFKEKVDAANALVKLFVQKGNEKTTQADVDELLKEITQTGLKGAGMIDKKLMVHSLRQYEALLASSFPGLVEPLIKERDIFLSLTMKSSMAVNGCKTVVGVVGLGHLDGVMQCLNEDHHEKFKTLTWTPSRAALKDKVLGVPRAVWQRLAWDTVLFGGLYALYVVWFGGGG